MSQNKDAKDDYSGSILAAAGVALGLILCALFALYAIFFSLVCISALHKPVPYFKRIIQPSEARAYLIRGVLGVVAGHILFHVALSNGAEMDTSALPYFMIGGYALASLGIEYLLLPHYAQNAARAEQSVARARELLGDEYIDGLNDPAKSYAFADWDDKQEKRK